MEALDLGALLEVQSTGLSVKVRVLDLNPNSLHFHASAVTELLRSAPHRVQTVLGSAAAFQFEERLGFHVSCCNGAMLVGSRQKKTSIMSRVR